MLGFWTIPRASGIGVVAGLASILLWQAYAAWQEPVRTAYLVALAVTLLCGATVLLLTAADMMFHRRRGRRIRPVRAFDIVLGLLLTLPTIVALASLLELPS
jgi:drug/metabolite transporter (DMT)-like permease